MKNIPLFIFLILCVLRLNAQEPNDCVNLITVCGNTDLSSLDAVGIGTQELAGNNSCSSQENNSLWLSVTITTDGTLAFTITPQSTDITIDFDFFIFGPDVSCNNLGQAIRCSTTNPQAAGQGNNLTGLQDGAGDFFEGPGNDGNSFVESINATAGETYFIVIDRPVGNSQFNLDFTGTATFNPPPTVEVPTGMAIDLEQCDTDGAVDGLTNFDLTVNSPIILGTQTDVDIAYFIDSGDALVGVNEIPDPANFLNTTNPQTIYVRLTNQTTECFETTEFELSVIDQPTANIVMDQLVCDDDNDGFWAFDLAALDNDVLGVQDSIDFSVTYHTIEQDAIDGINALVSPYTNVTAYTQEVIWVRIENNGNATCFDIGSFNINVFRTPEVNIVPDQLICDDDNDGFWALDLLGLEGEVLGTQSPSEYTISFYSNQLDADAATNVLTSPYTNQVDYTEEEIFVRIENNLNTNCFNTTSFLFDVFDTAMATSLEFALCDDAIDGDDTNGIVEFDLSIVEAQILGLQSNMQFTVSYYLNQTDADNGSPVLPLLYTNTTANTQQIVARVDNIDNADCYATAVIDLQVKSLPVITSLVELRQCDDDTNDGFVDFNLTEANQLISTNFAVETFSYYLLLADAESGMNAIANPTIYTNTDPSAVPDVLYFRVETTEGCYRTGQLNLIVSTTQIPLGFELVYEVCDDDLIDGDDSNGVASFDFSNATAQFEALFPVGQSLTITYYENLTDALAEANAIVDISNHINNGSPFVQNIVVRVDSDVDNGCLGLGEHIRLVVNPLPVVPSIDPLIECGVNGVFDFDLTQQEMNDITSLNQNRRFNDPGVFCKIAFNTLHPIYD